MEKYERIRVVGRGAFGIVHLCLRKADQKLVILKQIPVEQMSKDERLAAQNECQVLKLLSHPNVIEYYENFLEDKALMIAMEYAPGGTLAEFIHKRCNSLLDEDTILHFFVQILLALHHVHTKQILHRDLKTQNILLDKHRMIVKIGDFGISKILSSKSKAYTVVGTPCYISPELCEGKPYNQKSDIWALGCVLYELASLKRAFEAANLPALVLKIMSGTFAPISDRYSPDLRQLILSMLNLDPSKRPQLNEIMAQAICIRPLLNLYTDVGSVKMRRPEKPLAPVPAVTHGRTGGRVSSARPRGVRGGSARTGIPPPLSSIYTWGSGITTPLRLPMLNTEVVQVSAGRTQKAGVTKSGRLIMWEAPPMGAAGGPSLPGATEQLQPQFVSRFLEGQSGVTIKHVSCGDLFTACLTDRGIIMTFGSGSNGCLGHGNFTDVSQPPPPLLHNDPFERGGSQELPCGCCWQAPSLEPASNHTPACFALGLQLPGFTEKSYFSKEPVFKEDLCFFRLAPSAGAEGLLFPSSFFLACPRMWQQPMASSRARGLVPFVSVVSWLICASLRPELSCSPSPG
ncbi:serine/threonine-protein kinase Nek8 isoform X2 [Oxyura jamaicensis]|uniref:serine/threonine-protein kinase Nek8 isoform X2 n=1 Tax=Oxyura jamaicensis TaxID=8884 RepID=UPI0015A5B8D2|nr:serine/threonine-protein kinase Nek8 isoform X2 [Oxyura jamaicensis]